MRSLQMDVDDEISNLVDLHMGMFGGGWKWQDLQGLLWQVRSVLTDPEVQVKMEMEIPRSSGVHFLTACSYSTNTSNNLMKAQKSMSMPVQLSQTQDGERPQVDDQRFDLADDLKEAQVHISNTITSHMIKITAMMYKIAHEESKTTI
ncbi:hypothetical protein Tco_1015812 [Tanacetum coccineum]|uniref:Uncharacterized protein n=1 Tax=Tanacetum coccineum TaxID=301880 RepID=A0ABQ5FNR2_9ASTR